MLFSWDNLELKIIRDSCQSLFSSIFFKLKMIYKLARIVEEFNFNIEEIHQHLVQELSKI